MRRMLSLAAVLILLLSTLCACTPTQDYFDVFRGGFEADVAGEWNGQGFGAVFLVSALEEGSIRPLTITFYAPESLCGTVLSRGEDGSVELTVGNVTVGAPDGLMSLFELFPTGGEMQEVSLSEGGSTVVKGEDFVLTFASDGTPTAVSRGENSVTVLRFSRK